MTRDEHLSVIGMEECAAVQMALAHARRYPDTTQAMALLQAEWNSLVAVMEMAGIRAYAPEDYPERRAKRQTVQHLLDVLDPARKE